MQHSKRGARCAHRRGCASARNSAVACAVQQLRSSHSHSAPHAISPAVVCLQQAGLLLRRRTKCLSPGMTWQGRAWRDVGMRSSTGGQQPGRQSSSTRAAGLRKARACAKQRPCKLLLASNSGALPRRIPIVLPSLCAGPHLATGHHTAGSGEERPDASCVSHDTRAHAAGRAGWQGTTPRSITRHIHPRRMNLTAQRSGRDRVSAPRACHPWPPR